MDKLLTASETVATRTWETSPDGKVRFLWGNTLVSFQYLPHIDKWYLLTTLPIEGEQELAAALQSGALAPLLKEFRDQLLQDYHATEEDNLEDFNSEDE